MVSKMLKGLSRLMLTTVMLCSVGLFLFSNEVMAANSLAITSDSGSLKVTVERSTAATLSKITVKTDVGNFDYTTTESLAANTPKSITIPKAEFIKKLSNRNSSGVINVTDVEVYDSSNTKLASSPTGSYTTPKIIKLSKPELVTTVGGKSYKTKLTAVPAVTKFTIGGRDYKSATFGYGFADETYEITTTANTSYYENISVSANNVPWYTSGAFKSTGDSHTGKVGSSDTALKAVYYPRIDKVEITATNPWKIHLPKENKLTGTSYSLPFRAYLGANEVTGDDLTVLKETASFMPKATFTTSANINNTTSITTGYSSRSGSSGVTAWIEMGTTSKPVELTSTALPGKFSVGMDVGYLSGTTFKNDQAINKVSAATPLAAEVYACATGWTLDGSTSVAIEPGKTATFNVKIAPGGADQTLSYYGITSSTFTKANNNISSLTYADGKLTIKVGSSKTTTKITGKFSSTESGSITSDVSVVIKDIIAIDEDKTAKAVGDKAFITIGYTLDLDKLVNNNVYTNKNTLTKEAKLSSVTFDEDELKKYVTDASFKALTENDKFTFAAKAQGKVKAEFDLDDGTSFEANIMIYPMPTAKYNSDHTVTVTLPKKVSLGYDNSANIGEVKGLEYYIENDSKSSLASSKIEGVELKETTDYLGKYTVSASETESLVTTAASNGKFSGDTKVTFKVVPRGNKIGSTELITTDADKIYARTDSAQVYQVSAKGKNFTDSFAYGLDGQTVNLTAMPAKGFTFDKWSDGVTNNPRSIKVSGSGTRAFTPEAKEGAAAGAAGEGGLDDVPKTAESNAAIWLIIFMVFAVMGTAYALYLQLTAATSKNGK